MSDEFADRTPCCGAPHTKPGPCWKERPGLSFEGCVRWFLPTGDGPYDVPETVRECSWCEATWLQSDDHDEPEHDYGGVVSYADFSDEDGFQSWEP